MKTTGIRKLASYSATGVALALHLFAFSAYAQESIEVSSAAFDHDTDIPNRILGLWRQQVSRYQLGQPS